ncbi:hypothetical protein BS17DRAFT_479122 [Gyrodon lividus]|nr:hypothetical protein BS17DRAFT_479122 [Gyrodon lividus]
MSSNPGLYLEGKSPMTTTPTPNSTPPSATSSLPNSVAGPSGHIANAAPRLNPTPICTHVIDVPTPIPFDVPVLHEPSSVAVETSNSALPTPVCLAASSALKKAPRMHPGPARNGRNLAAHRWLKHFKSTTNGTTIKFNQCYLSLDNTQRQAYDREAEQIVANNAWNKDMYTGKIY